MASKSLSSFRMVVSRFCKATNCCNSAFTLYALLKRSGLNMTFLIVLDHHTTTVVGASGCWREEGSAGSRSEINEARRGFIKSFSISHLTFFNWSFEKFGRSEVLENDQLTNVK